MNKNAQQPVKQAKAPANDTEPRFEAQNATKLSEAYTFGPEAEKYLQKHFDYIYNQKNYKWNITKTKKHGHAYAAFCRKHMNTIVNVSLCPTYNLIDVGGHAIRTYITKDENGLAWHARVRSTLPEVDFNDQLRHQQWKQKYAANKWVWPLPNSCTCKSTHEGVCRCVNPVTLKKYSEEAQGYTSFDSAYYDGVIQGIEHDLTTEKVAYFSFHDYHAAIRKGKLSGSTFDGESSFEITNEGLDYYVTSRVNENPFVYKHKVINTQPFNDHTNDTWLRYNAIRDLTFVYHVEKRLDTGAGYDYVLVRCSPVKGQVPGSQTTPYFVEFEPISTKIKIYTGTNFTEWLKHVVKGGLQDVSRHLRNQLFPIWTYKLLFREKKIDFEISTADGDVFDMTITDFKTNGDLYMRDLKFTNEYVNKALQHLAGKFGQSDFDSAYRLLMREHLKDNDDGIHDTELVTGSLIFAMKINANKYIETMQYADANVEIRDARNLKKGISQITIRAKFFSTLMYMSYANLFQLFIEHKTTFIVFFILISMMKMFNWILSFIPTAMAHTGDLAIVETTDLTEYAIAGVLAILHTVYVRNKITNRRWLESSCVTNPERLVPDHCREMHLKYRNKELETIGMSPDAAYEKIACDKCGTIGAGQIAPIIRGTEYYTPTVKHKCNRNLLAAVYRNASVHILPDLKMVEEWKKGALHDVFNELRDGVEQEGGIDIDLDNWMSRYPLEYRAKIEAQLHAIDHNEKPLNTYDCFHKQELQFTKVPHSMKFTSENKVKERHIACPTTDQKIMFNAVMNEFEKIATKYVKGYCGNRNWQEICEKIDEAKARIPDIKFGEGDGSGFDTTQKNEVTIPWYRELADTIEKCDIRFNGVIWDKAPIVAALRRYNGVGKISVNRGDIVFELDFMPSGMGETTLKNGTAMVSYNRFVFERAKIVNWYLSVKGDDVHRGLSRKDTKKFDEMVWKIFSPCDIKGRHGLGQIMAPMPWGELCETSFLSCEFFEADSGTRMVRKMERILQTTPWSMKIKQGMKNLDQVARELCHSKGLCMLAWSKGLPIFENYARMLIRVGCPGSHNDINPYSDPYRVWSDSDDSGAFLAYLGTRFGITRAEMDDICIILDSIQTWDQEVVIPSLDKFLLSME